MNRKHILVPIVSASHKKDDKNRKKNWPHLLSVTMPYFSAHNSHGTSLDRPNKANRSSSVCCLFQCFHSCQSLHVLISEYGMFMLAQYAVWPVPWGFNSVDTNICRINNIFAALSRFPTDKDDTQKSPIVCDFFNIGSEIIWTNTSIVLWQRGPFPVTPRDKYVWVGPKSSPGHSNFFLCWNVKSRWWIILDHR